MIIKSFTFNPFLENTYIVSDDEGESIIIDPGCYEPHEEEELAAYISQQSLIPKQIFNTHAHIDHILGNQYVKKTYSVPLWIPVGEEAVYDAAREYSHMWGIQGYKPAIVDKFFDGNQLTVGQLSFQVIKAPGHSPGHLTLYSEKDKVLFGGDVLFRESIGRTDLPGGNHNQLLQSIRDNIFCLPDDVTVYPGHGPETTIGYERSHNPFLQ